jgi:hypothetical protein
MSMMTPDVAERRFLPMSTVHTLLSAVCLAVSNSWHASHHAFVVTVPRTVARLQPSKTCAPAQGLG